MKCNLKGFSLTEAALNVFFVCVCLALWTFSFLQLFFFLTQLCMFLLLAMTFVFRTVLVWDTRPSKSAAPSHAAGHNPVGILPTFKHLDLTWKPVLRVMQYNQWNDFYLFTHLLIYLFTCIYLRSNLQ